MDMAAFRTLLGPVSEARTAAVQSLAADPGTLAAVAGPELWLQLPDVLLGLPTFGIEPGPVFIDLNTAPEEFLMTLPGVGWAEADRIAAARLDHPFTSVEEAIIRLELDEQTATALRASPWSVEPDEAPTD
jgi:DNA uptake protein ComE-like DNA-binding protein